MTENVVIIGSGPAGWTAALYAARADLRPLVYEGALSEENRVRGTLPLGQLNLAMEVEDFPGFPEAIFGPELVCRMREQSIRFGARGVTEDIRSVDLSRHPFVLKDSTEQALQAHALIIATGACEKQLGLESEQRYLNHGVSRCLDDAPLPRYRNKPIVVTGGGDTACEQAVFLAKFASTVHLVHHGDTLRANATMVRRMLASSKVKIHWNSVVDAVMGETIATPGGDHFPSMTAVRLRNVKTNKSIAIEASGLFVAIGHTPNTRFLKGLIETDDDGFIKLRDPFRTVTSIEGVFAVGEVADPIYKQAITAAATGCKAALDAEKWLAARGMH